MLVGIPCYTSWFLVNVLLVAFFPLLIPIEYLGGAPGKRFLRRLSVSFFKVFFLFHLPLLGVYRVVRSDDLARLKKTGSVLVVANHTSWLDGLILFALIPNVRILVSYKYGRVPMVNRPMKWLGCIFVDRESRESVARAVAGMREALAAGHPVAVFPEGKRAQIGQLGPFRDVYFRIAKEARVSIQPVLLYLSLPFLGPASENFLTAKKADLKIRVLGAVESSAKESAGDAAFRVRREMKRALAHLAAEAGK
jgi:1-acyl-sn-glycerol-3-phosphate acyltransferase